MLLNNLLPKSKKALTIVCVIVLIVTVIAGIGIFSIARAKQDSIIADTNQRMEESYQDFLTDCQEIKAESDEIFESEKKALTEGAYEEDLISFVSCYRNLTPSELEAVKEYFAAYEASHGEPHPYASDESFQ